MLDRDQSGRGNKQFDLSKKKRNFDLTKDKVNDPKANVPENKQGSAKKVLIAIVAVVAVSLLASLLVSKGDSANPTGEDKKDVATKETVVLESKKDAAAENEADVPKVADETVVPVTQIQPATNVVADKVEQVPEKVKIDSQEPENVVDGLTPEKVEQKALEVIRGDFGNNPKRRRKLGSDYEVIQKKVNEMYRKGLVY